MASLGPIFIFTFRLIIFSPAKTVDQIQAVNKKSAHTGDVRLSSALSQQRLVFCRLGINDASGFNYLFRLVDQVHIWLNQRLNYNAAVRYEQIRLFADTEYKHAATAVKHLHFRISRQHCRVKEAPLLSDKNVVNPLLAQPLGLGGIGPI